MGGLEGGSADADDFLARLARWSAAERAGRAASERSRARALIDQSASGATWAGLLVDLAEAGAEVAVSLLGDPTVSGRLVGTARDFAVVERRRAGPVLVRIDAITSLAPATGGPGAADAGGAGGAGGAGAPVRPGGRRPPALELTLAAALDVLAAEQSPVAVRAGGETRAGSLTACGEDFLTLRLEGTGRPVYVPLRAVTCVELR